MAPHSGKWSLIHAWTHKNTVIQILAGVKCYKIVPNCVWPHINDIYVPSFDY